MKSRLKRGLALLLTLCLLGGNLAFAEALPGTGEEPVIKEETVAENEEAPVENAENTGLEAEDQLETSEENVPEPVRGAGDTIYLDGKNGDNTKDGSTPENAVKTFGQVKTLATNNQGVTKIVVIGTTEIKGDITLKGTKAKILRGENFNDYVFKVPAGEIATLKNITIDGNSPEKWEASKIEKSLIFVDGRSTLNVQDGTVIKNNKIMPIENTATRGGGIYASGATLNMSGGMVEGNQATYGGGICLSNSTMQFTGGTVQNNRAELVIDTAYDQIYSSGGGICAAEGSTIHMSGDAVVSKNFAHEVGGGISVGWNQGGDATTLYMSGGIIDGNEAGASGGGILIQAGLYSSTICKAYISAGNLNESFRRGRRFLGLAFVGDGKTVFRVARDLGGIASHGNFFDRVDDFLSLAVGHKLVIFNFETRVFVLLQFGERDFPILRRRYRFFRNRIFFLFSVQFCPQLDFDFFRPRAGISFVFPLFLNGDFRCFSVRAEKDRAVRADSAAAGCRSISCD